MKDKLLNYSLFSLALQYWVQGSDGGYPEPWIEKNDRFRKSWFDNYIQTYINRDIRKLFPSLNFQKYQLFIQMLGQLSGEVINYSNISRALGISQPTVRDYFNIAHNTFLWRIIYPYEKSAIKRIVKHPKGYLRDSGFLNHLLHLFNRDDLLRHPKMGQFWEILVIEHILRGFNIIGSSYNYYYYRTGGGAEIDLILDGEFGLIPIEVKYTQTVKENQLKSIKLFLNDYHCKCGIVINNSEKVVMYDKNILGIPFSYL